MKYNNLISLNNLRLAWRRVVTGKNIPYKRFYRSLYLAYEIAAEENLKLLHQKLKGSWTPSNPSRIYLPKPSGLQRPITLLSIEDQIVLQAVANLFAKKLYDRRKKVEYEIVFSNILSPPKDSIFFIEDWHKAYGKFQKKCENHYSSGFKWIAHFDLAAFYDTISHSLLLKTVSPRNYNSETCKKVKNWLQCWSTPDDSKEVDHGIPQGPIAANFLAESMLLSLDEHFLKQGIRYVRYVDDIRIFAKSEIEAQRAAVELEVYCRNIGLIPQGKKYAISKAEKLEDALGILPSIEPQDVSQGNNSPLMLKAEAENLFLQSLDHRPYKITDKSKARYVLFRAPKSKRILNLVLKLLPRHPEHIDAFVHFLRNYQKSKPTENTIVDVLNAGTPYGYVRGELYQVLARMGSEDTLKSVMNLAKEDLKRKNGCVVLKWGALSLLLSGQKFGLGKFSNRIKYQPYLVQSLLVPIIPDEEYVKTGVISNMLVSDIFEVGISVIDQLFKRNQSLKDYGLKLRQLVPVVQNVLKATGIVGRRFSTKIDQISDILHHQYKIKKSHCWRNFLRVEYTHALQILIQSDALYFSGPSNWLQLQNSFNDAIFRSLHQYMVAKGIPGGRSTKNRHGHLIDFGVLLEPSNSFSILHPQIVDIFREMNKRRNCLPGSHPYEKKTGSQTSYLLSQERNRFANKLKNGYNRIIEIIENS